MVGLFSLLPTCFFSVSNISMDTPFISMGTFEDLKQKFFGLFTGENGVNSEMSFNGRFTARVYDENGDLKDKQVNEF